MRDAIVAAVSLVSGIEWLEVIKTLASLATLGVALAALRNWRRQDKAKREAEYLDALIEAVHAYIAEMSTLITLVQMVKIGFVSYAPDGEPGEEADRGIKGAIAYISKNGEREAKRMLEAQKIVEPSVTKLRALAAKGQVFQFDEFVKCRNAITMLTWQFDRTQAVMAVIGATTMNWAHPKVVEQLKNVMAIDPEDISEHLRENNVIVLEFVSKIYRQIYG